jgi:hypothetical protein
MHSPLGHHSHSLISHRRSSTTASILSTPHRSKPPRATEENLTRSLEPRSNNPDQTSEITDRSSPDQKRPRRGRAMVAQRFSAGKRVQKMIQVPEGRPKVSFPDDRPQTTDRATPHPPVLGFEWQTQPVLDAAFTLEAGTSPEETSRFGGINCRACRFSSRKITVGVTSWPLEMTRVPSLVRTSC